MLATRASPDGDFCKCQLYMNFSNPSSVESNNIVKRKLRRYNVLFVAPKVRDQKMSMDDVVRAYKMFED